MESQSFKKDENLETNFNFEIVDLNVWHIHINQSVFYYIYSLASTVVFGYMHSYWLNYT